MAPETFSPWLQESIRRGSVHDGRNTQQWECIAEAVHLVENQEAESEARTRGQS